jgi:hypothetical protein
MDLASILKMEHRGLFFFAMFYLVAGVLNLLVLAVFGFGLFHVAMIAVLSFVVAFGLYRLQRWTLWPVLALLFMATAYGALMLNAFVTNYQASPDTGLAFPIFVYTAYLLLTWIGTVYVSVKRKTLR